MKAKYFRDDNQHYYGLAFRAGDRSRRIVGAGVERTFHLLTTHFRRLAGKLYSSSEEGYAGRAGFCQ